MQKDALRHKVPELSRGFPWIKKLLRLLCLLFFWSTLEDALETIFFFNCQLFIG